MILEELTRLDEPKRKAVAVLTVLVVACICYFAITRDSVTKLKVANASYTGVQTAYTGCENQQADLLKLQKQLGETEKQFQEYQQQYFGSKQIIQFFENINAMALAHNLKPISRAISEQKDLVDEKANDEEAELKQQFLKQQSVKITVSGNYYDIVDFLNHLTGRPEKVCITNLQITLPAGEEFTPKVSFTINLAIDLSKDT